MPADDANDQAKSLFEADAREPKETYSLPEYLDDLRKAFITPRSFMASRACEGRLAKGFLFVFLCSLLGAIGFGLGQRRYLYIPFYWVAGMMTNYMAGCFFHLISKLFDGEGDLIDTVRACNYSIAPGLFQGVPYLSGLAAVYSAYLLALGIAAAHKFSLLKACLLVGILTAAFAGGMTLMMHMSHGGKPPASMHAL